MVVANQNRKADQAYGDLEHLVSWKMAEEAWDAITAWDGYAPTPLLQWPKLARAAGLGEIRCKYEGARFGVGSFKALGGAYAAIRALRRKQEENPGLAAEEITVCTASDGNHGLSVAWGVKRAGAKAVIFLHAGVSQSRQELIEAMGGEVRRVAGNYDDSTAEASRTAREQGWILVADTSPDHAEHPIRVMSGYGVMVREIFEQCGDWSPTHIFLQGGCGGLAAGVAGLLRQRDNSADAPRIIIVEPDKADCLYRSAQEGRMVMVDGDLDTIMSGLSVGEVSGVAWPVIEHGVDFFIRISDEAAQKAMQAFARGFAGEEQIEIGDSGVAGIAGVLVAAKDPDMSARIGLGPDSRVLVIATEGPVDRASYDRLVAQPANGFSFGIAGE